MQQLSPHTGMVDLLMSLTDAQVLVVKAPFDGA